MTCSVLRRTQPQSHAVDKQIEFLDMCASFFRAPQNGSSPLFFPLPTKHRLPTQNKHKPGSTFWRARLLWHSRDSGEGKPTGYPRGPRRRATNLRPRPVANPCPARLRGASPALAPHLEGGGLWASEQRERCLPAKVAAAIGRE